jgi:hypothetical protein
MRISDPGNRIGTNPAGRAIDNIDGISVVGLTMSNRGLATSEERHLGNLDGGIEIDSFSVIKELCLWKSDRYRRKNAAGSGTAANTHHRQQLLDRHRGIQLAEHHL